MLEKGNFINNRYEIIGRVGAGGMSDVYKAKDHKLNRNVAIKVLKKEYSKDKNFVSKFRVEAQSAASLIHPNIVNVYDVGEDDGLYYIVMELIEGITLKNYIQKKGRLSVRETISIAIQIANGIECAHNNQIVHRDIKPQNIMISREGKVKVTDFGIARAASANTINGNAMGSVHYISPEQAGGKYVDEKSDIYSLGITMFEMVTGKVPFDGESTVTIALKHIQNTVPSIKEFITDVPVSIEKIILKCTQNRAERRYPKISLLIADLKRALSEPDADFVQLDAVRTGGSTVMITDEEINQIKKETGEKNKNIEPGEENIDDIDAMTPKMDRFVTIGGVVAGIVALVIVAVILTIVLSDNSIKLPKDIAAEEMETIDPRKTIVPNVIGMTSDEAEKALNEKNLGFVYDSNYVYSDIYAADQIVSQSETAGSIVDKNITVKLVVSKGAERIQVPSGIEKSDLDSAMEKLDDLGLKYEVTYEYSGSTIGTVISCTPNERAAVSKNDIIKLIVSRGNQQSAEKTATVPNVVNYKLDKAQERISSAGFGVGEVKEEYSDTVKKGYVIRQNVKSGRQMPVSGTISVVVSKGPEAGEKYTGSYTFALEDLHDANGNPITEGVVNVVLDGVLQKVDEEYADVSTWPGDYTIQLTGDKKGKATIELMVNGQIIHTGTVKLK
ncbi:Stk1 family PASTA domain-containing Ser/Thr kinase [uncultured Eubacterium sp.]|uniref:Stk1 family PASTA domain-containing Ser/Thr kinase n=1 Tax=uncultured Eubacterium sp. TaxID=165185 RepID=UPI002671A94E|nr:Stk1 family PASTA domain-containing Ser/Thr kinase [uncultured Eubacterium sp.]